MTVCSVLIADSNARLARVLAELLADEPDFTVLDVCSTPDQVLDVARDRRPDVVLVSERLAGEPGAETCAAVRAVLPAATVLLWSHDPARQAASVADAVLERGMTFRDLVDVVRRARGGTPAVAARPVRVPVPKASPDDLDDPEGHMVVACATCGLRRPIPTDDMPSAVLEARTFFASHDRCDTSIDLTDRVSPDLLSG